MSAAAKSRQTGNDIRRQRALVTPEGIDLGVVIGSAGARLAALFIDIAIIVGTFVALVVFIGSGFSTLGQGAREALGIMLMIGWFLLRNAWFIIFESGKRAATPGKRVMGLRVVSRDGSALSVDQVIARNLVRDIELFLPLTMLGVASGNGSLDGLMTLFGLGWALLFSLFLLFNKDRMRIGDLLAGTWVIETGKQKLGADLTEAQFGSEAYAFTQDQLDAYGVAELTRLEEVLRLRDADQMWIVSDAISAKIGWDERVIDPEGFLRAYYNGLRENLERGMMFGHKRLDKHDAARRELPAVPR